MPVPINMQPLSGLATWLEVFCSINRKTQVSLLPIGGGYAARVNPGQVKTRVSLLS